MDTHMRDLLPSLVGHVPGSTLCLALEDYKPFAFADDGGPHEGGECSTVAWVRQLADMARSSDRASRMQAATLMRHTFKSCSELPRVQVVAVGVLLALVRQAGSAWECAAAAIAALSELEQGLWRLGADAGGHREAALLLGRYMPEGIKAASALAKARAGGDAAAAGREEAAIADAVLTAAYRTLLLQPSTLRPLYADVVAMSARHLGDDKATLRSVCARVLALTPAAVPRDALAASSTPPWQRLTDDLYLAATHLMWQLDGLGPDGSPAAQVLLLSFTCFTGTKVQILTMREQPPDPHDVPPYLKSVARLPVGVARGARRERMQVMNSFSDYIVVILVLIN
jgi:hypothetical protein